MDSPCFRDLKWGLVHVCAVTGKNDGCSERIGVNYSLLEGLGYVSCSLNVTRRMKYPRSSAPPTISESSADDAALRTATVQRWVCSREG